MTRWWQMECDAYDCTKESAASDSKAEARRWALQDGWTQQGTGQDDLTFCPDHKFVTYETNGKMVKLAYNGKGVAGRWRILDGLGHVMFSDFETITKAADYAEERGMVIIGQWAQFTSPEAREMAARARYG